MLTDHPELFDGMRLVPCAVMTDNDNPQAGWLFIPHADGKWVSAAKLQPLSQQIINYWWNRPRSAEVRADKFDMAAHLARQREWSERTFGPDARVNGIVSHIRKELNEIIAAPEDLSEWIDVVILALDGAWRAGYSPDQIIAALVAKQTKNEGRQWPDWRTVAPDTAIEHVREPGEVRAEAQPVAPCHDCEARAIGDTVLVPSSDLKKLQAKVAELKEKMFNESETFVNFLNIDHPKALGERDRIITEQHAEIERLTNDRRSMVEDVRHYHENEQTNLANIDELKELHSGAAFNAKYFKSHYEKLGEAFNEQAALIERCEQAQVRALAKLAAYVGVCNGDKELTGSVLPLLRESLAAITSYKNSQPK